MRYTFLLTITISLFACTAKKSKVSLDLIPVKQGDYWGYVDQTGKMIINPQFKSAFAFQDGLALVQNTSDKYGFIDKKGNFAIQPNYKDAQAFNEGLAVVVKQDQRIEYIDTKGSSVLMLGTEIDRASGFNEDLALVESNGKYGFIDRKGKIVIPCQYEYALRFNEGLASVTMKTKDQSLDGFINKDGKMVINAQFESAYSFSEGRALFKQKDKYGYIDKDGKIVITPQFDDAGYSFKNGLCPAKQGELWGFIGKDGKFVINPQFKEVGIFSENGFAAIKSTTNDKWGFINKEGKTVIEPQFESSGYFIDDVAVSKLGEKYGLIDDKGKYKFNPQFDAISVVSAGYFGFIESDYFDASNITGLLFKDYNTTSFKGISKGATFNTIQKALPDITHNNYNWFTPYTFTEENKNLELDKVGVVFENNFTSYEPQYKVEPRYDYYSSSYVYQRVLDKYETVYNDNVPIVGVSFRYLLKSKASQKSVDILKLFSSRIPQGFQSEYQEGKYLLLHNSSYYLKLKVDGNYLIAVMAFSRDSYNDNINVDSKYSDSTVPATTDSTTINSN